jgi:hypothetical protein
MLRLADDSAEEDRRLAFTSVGFSDSGVATAAEDPLEGDIFVVRGEGEVEIVFVFGTFIKLPLARYVIQ